MRRTDRSGPPDVLQRVFPTLVVTYPKIRGCICRETPCDRSSVTFRLRQCARREGSSRVKDVEGWHTA